MRLVTTGNTRERCHPADYITLRLRMNMVFCAATVLSHPCPSWVIRADTTHSINSP
jgi:hypothetical protein